MAIDDYTKKLNKFSSRERLARLEEYLPNLVNIGEVTAVNHDTMTASVTVGNITDVRVFMLASGSGHYRQWTPPVIGDRVLIISDNGELNNSYALPLRLPAAFNSDITGSIVRAGDLTIRYNQEDNTYDITHGDKFIMLDEDNITLENDNASVTLTPNAVNVDKGNNSVTVNNSGVHANAGAASLDLTSSSCSINVPGGILNVSSGSLSFNGQEVHRG